MSHACHRFWKWHKTLTFCSLLTRCTIPCPCHAKRRFNVQKWSEPLVFLHFFDIASSKSGPTLVFCTFWLGNVLRATTACNFSSLICPAGSAPVALASLLFNLPEPQIIGKTQCFATFLPFRAPGWVFFLLRLSLYWSSFFFSLLWLFPFLLFICPYCRKFEF